MTIGFSVGLTQEDIDENTSSLFDLDGDTGVRTEVSVGSDEDTIVILVEGTEVAVFHDDHLILDFKDKGFASFGGAPGNERCAFTTINSTGLDWCNQQVGDMGSAFYTMRKSLGTIDNPLPLTDGIRIGGIGAIGFDGTTIDNADQGTGYVGGELTATAVGDQNAGNGGMSWSLSVTPLDEKDRILTQSWLDNGDVQLHTYPDSRDDGPSPTARHLFVGPTGIVQSGANLFLSDGPTDRLNDSTTFQGVLAVLMPDVYPAGLYEIIVSGEVSIDVTNTDYEGRIFQDGNRLGQTVRWEGKDAAGAGIAVDGDNSGTDQRRPLYMRRLVTLTGDEGVNGFFYNHAPTANGPEATIFDAIMTVEFRGPA